MMPTDKTKIVLLAYATFTIVYDWREVFKFQVIASLLVYKLLEPSHPASHWVPVHANEFTLVGPDAVVHVLPVVLYFSVEPPATHVVPLFKTALNI